MSQYDILFPDFMKPIGLKWLSGESATALGIIEWQLNRRASCWVINVREVGTEESFKTLFVPVSMSTPGGNSLPDALNYLNDYL